MARILLNAFLFVSSLAATLVVAEPLPSSLFIDDVQIYDVPQGKRRTVTCAQRRSLDEQLFAGTVVTKLSENYLETVTFVPLDEAFKRLKRRARKARGTKRNKLTRRVQKTAKKIRTCKKGVGATAAVLGNFSCDFVRTLEYCDSTGKCDPLFLAGVHGSGRTLAEAYEDGWEECLFESFLTSQLDAHVSLPVLGEYTILKNDNGCQFSNGCGIDPVGTEWSIYRCQAAGAYKTCPPGQPTSSACEEKILAGGFGGANREESMRAAVENCENDDFAVKKEAAAFDGLEAFKTRACLPHSCSRFISYVDSLTAQ